MKTAEVQQTRKLRRFVFRAIYRKPGNNGDVEYESRPLRVIALNLKHAAGTAEKYVKEGETLTSVELTEDEVVS